MKNKLTKSATLSFPIHPSCFQAVFEAPTDPCRVVPVFLPHDDEESENVDNESELDQLLAPVLDDDEISSFYLSSPAQSPDSQGLSLPLDSFESEELQPSNSAVSQSDMDPLPQPDIRALYQLYHSPSSYDESLRIACFAKTPSTLFFDRMLQNAIQGSSWSVSDTGMVASLSQNQFPQDHDINVPGTSQDP
ncbi:hypothetical protein HDU91_002681 [Kappamyces sp. JEL0680]|nr:hypothetical protein HDU91_002681 [Kappamyces sp. JEL0680]